MISLALFLTFSPVSGPVLAVGATPVQEVVSFPEAPPVEQGIDPEALGILSETVDRLLANDAIVGAELHVIQNRRTVLHRAYGHADRESERPMEVNSVHCIRSMTKPFVGTAIQMLLDEGELSLGTRAAEILPVFDTEATADITIDHLLTHSAGFPFSTITRPLAEYEHIREIAAEAAATRLLFEPGTGFQYSDAGSDTLGAIVAEVTGMPVEDFIQERILDPLGMEDSVTLLANRPDAKARIPSAYSGGPGSWMRHWMPTGPVMFPLFLTSQSLYSTTTDYARFLTLWMDGGRDLLSKDAVQRGLSVRQSFGPHTALSGLEVYYGQQWMLYADPDGGATGPGPMTVFGHNGSDGTHAWAWPERDLIILYFTQSRGTTSGTDLERVIDRVLIQGDVAGYREEMETRVLAADAFRAYEGLYWDETNIRACYVVRQDGERLAIERPGSFSTSLEPRGPEGHFKMVGTANEVQFEAPVEGLAPAMIMSSGGSSERQLRHQEDLEAPLAEDVINDMRAAHGVDEYDGEEVIRITGKVKMITRGLEGRATIIYDASRYYSELVVAGTREETWLTTDGRSFTRVNGGHLMELQGATNEQIALRHPIRRFDDWLADYPTVEVLREINNGREGALMVRTITEEGEQAIKLLDDDTGMVMAEDRFDVLPGVGKVGLRTAYGDYREVAGLQQPFIQQFEYAFELIGKIRYEFEEAEVGVEDSRLDPPAGD